MLSRKTDNSGGVAQLVEQRTENPCVTSSILVLATIFCLFAGRGHTVRHFHFQLSGLNCRNLCFFCIFDGFCHKSCLFYAGNLGQLIDFQIKILPIPEPVSLSDQPSDFIVESFGAGIGQMVKRPISLNAFQIVPNSSCHCSQFGKFFASSTIPSLSRQSVARFFPSGAVNLNPLHFVRISFPAFFLRFFSTYQ